MEARLKRMMDEYGSTLLRTCAVILKDRSLAQDAVQDTFIKAYRHMESFKSDCSEKTYLTGIAVNTCRDYLRRKWYRTLLFDVPPERPDEDRFPDDTVLTEVMKLPRKLREVILLRFYEQMKQDEIAEALNISKSAVKKRLTRAQEILKERLKEWYYEE